MERFSDLLARLSVTTTSADRSITANLTSATGLTVRLHPEHLAHHDDTSLSGQLSQTLSKTLAAARRATRIAQDRSGVEHDRKRLAAYPLGRRRLAFEAAAETTTGTGRSADRMVSVSVEGATGIRVRLRPRTVHHVASDRIAAAVNEAVAAARAQQGSAVVAAYHQAFDIDETRSTHA